MSAHPLSTADLAETVAAERPAVSSEWQSAMSLGDVLRSRRIVVAVSGAPDGVGAVRVAAALERRYRCQVSAVQVVDVSDQPLLVPQPGACTSAAAVTPDPPHAEAARSCRQRIGDWLGQSNPWPIHMSAGAAAYEIARYAERADAALIVMGLRRHGDGAGRVPHDETTLTVAQLSNRAVLAVAPELIGSPHQAIVGVDFGPTSILAARAARDLVRSPASSDPVHLRLVYVDRSAVERRNEDTAGEALVRHLGIAAAFEQLVGELAAPPGMRVDCVTRHGDTAAELLACADESRADLIVVGSVRHERTERSVLGSVTTAVIRDGRCSVLVIPPSGSSPPA